jgi:hypothetical protein
MHGCRRAVRARPHRHRNWLKGWEPRRQGWRHEEAAQPELSHCRVNGAWRRTISWATSPETVVFTPGGLRSRARVAAGRLRAGSRRRGSPEWNASAVAPWRLRSGGTARRQGHWCLRYRLTLQDVSEMFLGRAPSCKPHNYTPAFRMKWRES